MFPLILKKYIVTILWKVKTFYMKSKNILSVLICDLLINIFKIQIKIKK